MLVIVLALSKGWRAAPLMITLAAAITLLAIQFGGLSSGGEDTVQQMARLVQQHHTGNESVGTYGVFVRNLVFYSGVRTTDIITDDQAQEFLAQPTRAFHRRTVGCGRSARARARIAAPSHCRAAVLQ